MAVAAPVLLGIVSVLGLFGQTLTLFMLRRVRAVLNKSLDSATYRLMVSQAWGDILILCLALPLSIWNKSRGYVWPFTMPGMCYHKRVLQAALAEVSCYHILLMAVIRCCVVYSGASSKTKSRLQNVGLKAFICAIPWVIGYATTIVGYACAAYKYSYSFFTNNNCDLLPGDFSSASIKKLVIFFAADVVLGILLPMIIATILSLIALIKAYLIQRRAARQPQQRGTANGAGAGAGVNNAWSDSNRGNSMANLAARSKTEENARQFGAVRAVAVACFANMVLLFPLTLAPMAGYTFTTEAQHPSWALFLEFLYYSSFCVIPFVYAISSSDMRAGYIHLIKKLLCMATESDQGVQQQQNSQTPAPNGTANEVNGKF